MKYYAAEVFDAKGEIVTWLQAGSVEGVQEHILKEHLSKLPPGGKIEIVAYVGDDDFILD